MNTNFEGFPSTKEIRNSKVTCLVTIKLREDPICADFDELSKRKSQLHSISITI